MTKKLVSEHVDHEVVDFPPSNRARERALLMEDTPYTDEERLDHNTMAEVREAILESRYK